MTRALEVRDPRRDHSGSPLVPRVRRAQRASGLGAQDEARLFLPDGSTLVDSFSWATHSDPSWSRCPDGIGTFIQGTAITLGGPNSCPATATPATWPGSSTTSFRCS